MLFWEILEFFCRVRIQTHIIWITFAVPDLCFMCISHSPLQDNWGLNKFSTFSNSKVYLLSVPSQPSSIFLERLMNYLLFRRRFDALTPLVGLHVPGLQTLHLTAPLPDRFTISMMWIWGNGFARKWEMAVGWILNYIFHLPKSFVLSENKIKKKMSSSFAIHRTYISWI